MITNRFTQLLVLALAAMVSACTVTDTQPPPLAGPSEMSLSLAITANPDVLSLDGASQSQIVIEARDLNGQPSANIPLRVEILADGQSVDFGTVSARTLVTGTTGRATFTYTAPQSVGPDIPSLSLRVTPTGTDASAHLPRLVSIRLVPPGVILPGGHAASFTFSPSSPQAFVDVLFNASQSTAPLGGAITSYSWNFGDGSTGSGATVNHRFAAGSHTVTLTTTASDGSTASTSQLVTVAPGTIPTALFVFSPTEPEEDQNVFFNAGQSTAAPGRRIVSYRWNFGDGTTATGVTRTKKYTADGTYVVVLTVTDDAGQVGTVANSVTICPVGGCEEE